MTSPPNEAAAEVETPACTFPRCGCDPMDGCPPSQRYPLARADTIDLDALEKVAREAGEQRWNADLHHLQYSAGRTYAMVHGGAAVPIAGVTLGVEGTDHSLGRARAKHIATFDPPTVRKLIAAARASRPTPEAEVEAVAKVLERVSRWINTEVPIGTRAALTIYKAVEDARDILSRSPGDGFSFACRHDPKSIDAGTEAADALARRFHEAYERLAPQFSYKTRPASAVPWEQLPSHNRLLMTAVCAEILASAAGQALSEGTHDGSSQKPPPIRDGEEQR